MSQSLTKKEILRSRKVIDELMTRGKSFVQTPVRTVWMESQPPNDLPINVLFSVPKKKINKAVLRNRIKRRMKEAYRKNKHPLSEVLKRAKKHLVVAFIYTSPEETEYPDLERKILLSLHRLGELAQQ